MSVKKKIPWAIFLTISWSLVSCDSWFHSYTNPQSISEIANKKNGKIVYVAGEIIRTVPLVNNGAYQLKDDTDKVWILTNAKLPSTGEKIVIKGKIQYQELPFSEQELYLQEIETQPYSVITEK